MIIRAIYGILVLAGGIFLIFRVMGLFSDWWDRAVAIWFVYSLFSYWYVPVLNYSAYTPTPVPYIYITLIKDILWIFFLMIFIYIYRHQIFYIPKQVILFAGMILSLLPILLLVNGNWEILLISHSLLLYLPLTLIVAVDHSNIQSYFRLIISAGSVLGGLAVSQLLIGVPTYLELARGSYPRATATLSGPTPLATTLIFTFLFSLTALLYLPSFRQPRVYISSILISIGIITTTALSPVIAFGVTSVFLLIVHIYIVGLPSGKHSFNFISISVLIGVVTWITVPTIRYRVLGALGFSLEHPIAVSTYRSRNTRIEQIVHITNDVVTRDYNNILFGSGEDQGTIEIFYLYLLNDYGLLLLGAVSAFLLWCIVFSFRSCVSRDNNIERGLSFAVFGYVLVFIFTNVGSPIWSMYPLNMLLYLSIGLLIGMYSPTPDSLERQTSRQE